MQKLFLRSQNLIACFSHTAFFSAKFIIPVSVLQNPACYYGYTTSYYNFASQMLLTPRDFFFLNYNSACFTTGDIFLFMGFILKGPECLHPHRCEREPRIRCVSLSPLNMMLQQPNECTNKVLDSSYLPGTVWSRKHLLQWTRILMKSKMYLFLKKWRTCTVKSAYYCITFDHAEELFSSYKHYIHYLGFQSPWFEHTSLYYTQS